MKLLPIMLILASVALASVAGGSPATLVVREAQDTERGFVARDLEDLGRRVLAWPDGLLSVADTAAWMDAGESNLAFALQPATTVAIGADGRLPLQPGNYDIDTPLMLDDGHLVAYFADGRLEITAHEIVYRRPAPRIARRGTLLLLAGIAVATGVLLRAVRRRPRRS